MLGSLQGQDRCQRQKYIEILDKYAELIKEYQKYTDTLPLPLSTQFWRDLQSIQPLLRLWDRYEKECYKDSSVVRQHVGKEGEMCIIDWECVREHHYQIVTIHRKPNIYDFIEWLKKQ
jgi:hypothetical protein